MVMPFLPPKTDGLSLLLVTSSFLFRAQKPKRMMSPAGLQEGLGLGGEVVFLYHAGYFWGLATILLMILEAFRH